jgi:hypothetical protein
MSNWGMGDMGIRRGPLSLYEKETLPSVLSSRWNIHQECYFNRSVLAGIETFKNETWLSNPRPSALLLHTKTVKERDSLSRQRCETIIRPFHSVPQTSPYIAPPTPRHPTRLTTSSSHSSFTPPQHPPPQLNIHLPITPKSCGWHT